MVEFAFGPHLAHSTLGFERIFNDLDKVLNDRQQQVTFPPHNILKIDRDHYVVELAIAGFDKDEIDITVEDNVLIIKGIKKEKAMKDVEYIHKGIGTRSFTKTLTVADTIEVKGAEFNNGILRVGLVNVIPDHKKPRKIEIGKDLNLLEPKLLQEEAK